MIVWERRASAILHNLVRTHADPHPYLLPANVCPIVRDTLLQAGQTFELVDIAEPSLAIDMEACIERARGRRAGHAGLIFVRPYGSETDPAPLFRRLKEIQPDILLIDDKCLCRPDCDAERLTEVADVTLFSTGYAKYADIGGGGFAHLRETIAYGRDDRAGAEWLDLRPPEWSWNDYRRLTIEATRVADEQKQRLNEIYARTLPPQIQLAPEFQSWRFNIRVPSSGRLLTSVFEAGLFASRHYASLGEHGSFPSAERLHADIVNLFNDRYFDETRARRITELVLQHIGRQS